MSCAPVILNQRLSTLDLIPLEANIRAAGGATVAIAAIVRRPDGTPIDVTGLTFEAPILSRNGSAPPVAAWTASQSASNVVRLELTDEQSVQLIGPAWGWALWAADASGDRLLFARGGLLLLEP